MVAGKTLLYFTNLLFPNNYQKMARWFISSLKINMAKENIHIKKIDKRRNYLVEK